MSVVTFQDLPWQASSRLTLSLLEMGNTFPASQNRPIGRLLTR